MAIRTLDPVFWDDEGVGLLSRDARLLLVCMITDPSLSDDYGVLPTNARTLRKHAFPYDEDVTVEQVEQWRDEILAKFPNLVLYQADGKPWLWLRNFEKFQGLRYHRKTSYPKPPDIVDNSGKLPEISENFPCIESSSVVLDSSKDSVYMGAPEKSELLDPVEHMLTASAMGPGIASPADDKAAWMQYGNEALNTFHAETGLYPNPAQRDDILGLAGESGFVLERWKSSCHTCAANLKNAGNVGCMIDTYRAGGDYRKMMDKRNRGGTNAKYQRDNGRESREQQPPLTLEFANRVRAAHGQAPLESLD